MNAKNKLYALAFVAAVFGFGSAAKPAATWLRAHEAQAHGATRTSETASAKLPAPSLVMAVPGF